ncbi:hypothetical protein [Streptomyces natalensis]|uniref:Uncharacterized protein n=1 Tax=Streptomyces natalensis ATCC 27448 TaxID=1240678 RepID=A0A0D7CG84_9ACTN|nr:hypothetical protein [Streptomyces natalensis]KIZ15051.1 hypothetical protein SNA_29460 [Streptomyces natalensis ATCC 27448]
MTEPAHVTADNFHQDQATPRPRVQEIGNYLSPAYQQWAEQVERDTHPPVETFQLPITAAALESMSYADRVRVYTEDVALYDRLTGRTAACPPRTARLHPPSRRHHP